MNMIFLLGSKILLGYEKALWPKQLEISQASQILTHEPQIWFFLSYLITTVPSVHIGIALTFPVPSIYLPCLVKTP